MGVVITNVELLPNFIVTSGTANDNLIRNTKDFFLDGNRIYGWRNSGSWSFSKDSQGMTLASKSQTGQTSNNIPSLYSSYVTAKKGDAFTFSCWFMVDDINKWDGLKAPYIFEVYNSSGSRVQYQDVKINLSNTNKPSVTSGKWVMLRSYHTVTADDATRVGMRVSLFRNGSIHVGKCKVEKGIVSNPIWMPENVTTVRVAVKETVAEPKMHRLPFKLGQKKGGIK